MNELIEAALLRKIKSLIQPDSDNIKVDKEDLERLLYLAELGHIIEQRDFKTIRKLFFKKDELKAIDQEHKDEMINDFLNLIEKVSFQANVISRQLYLEELLDEQQPSVNDSNRLSTKTCGETQ